MSLLAVFAAVLIGSAVSFEPGQTPIARFTVSVPTANVRELPATTSRVVARLPRGAIVDVMSQKDGWVQVVLPDDRGAVRTGYVLGTLGMLEAASPPVATDPGPATTVSTGADAPASPVQVRAEVSSQIPTEAPVPSAATPQPATPFGMPPRTRTLGLGGRVGGFTFGVGGSARLWSKGNLGLQMDLSRYSIGASDSFGGISVGVKYSVIQFGPSVLYTFQNPDPDEDVWIRPYAGGGLNFYRSSLSTRASGLGQSENTSDSASNIGFQVLGGAEAIFKRFPRLGVSGDLGYYSTGTPFVGLQIGGFAYGVSLHWYVK